MFVSCGQNNERKLQTHALSGNVPQTCFLIASVKIHFNLFSQRKEYTLRILHTCKSHRFAVGNCLSHVRDNHVFRIVCLKINQMDARVRTAVHTNSSSSAGQAEGIFYVRKWATLGITYNCKKLAIVCYFWENPTYVSAIKVLSR